MNIPATELAIFGTLRSEERKSYRNSIIQSAIENYKFVVEKSKNPIHLPWPIYLIYISKMVDLAFDKTVTSENLKNKLIDISRLVAIMESHTKEMTEGIRP